MFAQALQIVEPVAAAVTLRQDVINVRVALAKFTPAFGAGVPAVVGFVFIEPVVTISPKVHLSLNKPAPLGRLLVALVTAAGRISAPTSKLVEQILVAHSHSFVVILLNLLRVLL